MNQQYLNIVWVSFYYEVTVDEARINYYHIMEIESE